MNRRHPLVMTGLAAAWLVLVIGGVRLAGSGWEAWGRQSSALERSRELLRRYKGWVEVEPQVEAGRERVLGSFAGLKQRDLHWAALERFQETTRELGMTVAELRPTRLPARAGQPASFRLDAKVEGLPETVAALLRRLPDEIPGVGLEQLQVSPAEEGKLQVLIRISFGTPV